MCLCDNQLQIGDTAARTLPLGRREDTLGHERPTTGPV